MKTFLIAAVTSYLLSIAVVFAGMILTPTKKSRELEAANRLFRSGLQFEVDYLMAKLQVAVLWPWYAWFSKR
jgi:hypothetical protein